jgi:hypothetical protein
LRLAVDDAKGLGRGTYLLKFRYRTDLVKGGALERDGTMVRLRWLGPRLPAGLDGAKMTVVLPAAPTEPRAGERDDLGLSTTGAFMTTTRRFPDRDEVELVRPHVAKAEQVAWAVRIDPRSLGEINDPRVRPLPSSSVQAIVRTESRERQVFLAVAAGVAILFTALTAIKGRQVEIHAKAAQSVARPFFLAPVHVRAFFAGPAVALGVGLQLLIDPPVIGTFFLLVAMLLMAHRTPLARPAARGPGRWLPIAESEAFPAAPRPRDAWLDISTRGGKGAFVLAILALSVAGWATHQVSPYHASLVGLDGLMLLALFFTGRASEFAPTVAAGPVPFLRDLTRRLRAAKLDLKVVPWARFPQGQASHDELRLLVMPKAPLRGLNGIEIGATFPVGAGGPIVCPEVLVRVVEESDAERKVRQLAPFGRWVRGRRPGELVLAIEPRFGAWKMAYVLVRSLCVALAEEAPKRAAAPARAAKPSSKASRASGKGEATVKAGAPGAPPQVTEAACSA